MASARCRLAAPEATMSASIASENIAEMAIVSTSDIR
jgi:hypothetical protein